MKMLITPILALGLFSGLACYSFARYAPEPKQGQGYSLAQVAEMDSFVAVQLAAARKKPKVTHREQAEAYRMVYGITDDNINSYKEWW